MYIQGELVKVLLTLKTNSGTLFPFKFTFKMITKYNCIITKTLTRVEHKSMYKSASMDYSYQKLLKVISTNSTEVLV